MCRWGPCRLVKEKNCTNLSRLVCVNARKNPPEPCDPSTPLPPGNIRLPCAPCEHEIVQKKFPNGLPKKRIILTPETRDARRLELQIQKVDEEDATLFPRAGSHSSTDFWTSYVALCSLGFQLPHTCKDYEILSHNTNALQPSLPFFSTCK